MEQGDRDRAGELAGQDVPADAQLAEDEGRAAGQPAVDPAARLSASRETPSLRARIHAGAKLAWRRLRGGELTPGRAALSVAVGLAIGVTPLYGLHFWLVVAVCVPLRLDAALAYLAANVSLPFIAPFLLLAEVEIGAWVTTGRGVTIGIADLKARALGEMVHEVVVGTLIFAPAIALVGGLLAFGIAKRARAARAGDSAPPPGEERDAIDRVAARYAKGRRATYHYVRSKLKGDPVCARIAAIAGLGEVVDIGCGRGQLAALLLETRTASRVVGIDWDSKKLADARAAMDGLPATFVQGDARTCDVPEGDTVLLVDVLHYMTDEEQDAVLDRAARGARSRIIVRELDPERGWRSAVTRAQERITTALRYNVGARVNARPIAAMAEVLKIRGFDVAIEPCWGATPFANVIVIASRKPWP